MTEKSLHVKLTSLSAKVTALTMLVEALWASELSKDEDPTLIGKIIIDDIFHKDAEIRQKIGESDYSLQISEALTSLIDRAVAKALRLRSKRPRP